mgnify:CR=1 FL=1
MILGKSVIFETMNWENISIKQSYELQKASELYEDEFDIVELKKTQLKF